MTYFQPPSYFEFVRAQATFIADLVNLSQVLKTYPLRFCYAMYGTDVRCIVLMRSLVLVTGEMSDRYLVQTFDMPCLVLRLMSGTESVPCCYQELCDVPIEERLDYLKKVPAYARPAHSPSLM